MLKLVVSLAIVLLTTAVSIEAVKTGTPHSTVQSLTKADFRKAIQDPANGLWLLKFYAPWCTHCKKLAPVLEEVAVETTGRMAIGKIDCDKEKELCKEFNIKGFPTLMFSRDGNIQEFPFSRSKEDIKKFADKMNDLSVTLCNTHDDALQVASTTDNGIVFVGYHPDIRGDDRDQKLQSTHLSQVLGQSARISQAFATFCLLSSTADLNKFGLQEAPDGFIAKVEAGGVPPVLLKGTKDITAAQVLDFVKERNVPLVATLGPHNFNKIGRNGKPLVIGAVDGSNDAQVKSMKQSLLNYALNGPKAIVDKYYYGWIDGKQWSKFLTQFNITLNDLPQIIVLDVPTKTYWYDSTYETLDDFMTAVDNGTVKKLEAGRAKSAAISNAMNRFIDIFVDFYPWSVGVLVAVLVLLILLILPAPEEMRPPYPPESTTATTATKSKAEDVKAKETAETTDAVKGETKKEK